ncbi:hypothetical protein AVEN_12781-1 [Araneus ventricosus]|uniref:Uncharacterized protein n=1 Tax=Araneus ventricosus TaxID=182803 RepID=A0A4Y2ABT5_ARAVE|nr:hypothetical protein AVEN_12781-1 [Araneus ventricosus]
MESVIIFSFPDTPLDLYGTTTLTSEEDLNTTSSLLVYGTTLCLPSDLISTDALQTSVAPTYVSKLVPMMSKLSPITPVSHSCTKIYAHPSLTTCTHVFLRNDNIRSPLTPPYSDPHPVVSHTDKDVAIDLNGKSTTVSIDRLKPVCEFSEDFDSQKGSSNFEPLSLNHKSKIKLLLQILRSRVTADTFIFLRG